MKNRMEPKSKNDQYLFSKSRSLLKSGGEAIRSDKKTSETKKHLILGLENTLIWFSTDIPPLESEAIEMMNNGSSLYGIFRPGLLEFLQDASKFYSISIYTTLQEKVAEKILEAKGALKYISKIYHQEYCKKIGEDLYLKSILPLKLPLNNTVFIEESPTQIRSQPLNGLLIKRFEGNSSDQALNFLRPFLADLAKKDEFRPVAAKLYEFFNQVDLKDGQNRLETITETGCDTY